MSKIRLALLGTLGILTTLAAGIPTAGANAEEHYTPEYLITITNNTSGQFLTPPNVAIHDSSVRVFRQGQAASAGIQAVAENGGVPVLAAELQANIDDAGKGTSAVAGADGPLFPGQSTTLRISSDASRFSLASMIICTNDGFGGVNNRPLPTRDGASRRFNIRDFDAGTEINTELRADLVPAPFCQIEEGVGTGMSNPDLAENGVIRAHRTITGAGDLDSSFDWKRGTVGTVTITRVG